MKKYIRFGIGILLTIFFLYLSYKRVEGLEFSKMAAYPINYMLVLSSVLFFLLAQWFRALAWSKGLSMEFNSLVVFKAVCIGNAVNMVMPFRLGEVARVAVLGKGKSRSYANAGVCLLAERLIDIIILIILAVAAVFFINFSPNVLNKIRLMRNLVIIASIIGLLMSGVIIWMKSVGSGIFSWLRNHVWGSKLINILEQIQVLKSPLAFFRAGAFLSLSWFSVYICTVLGILSVGIGMDKVLPSALAVLVMTNLAMLIPAAPGGIGVFQYACIYSLGLLGVNGIAAAVLSVLLHIVQYAALLPIGLYFFLSEKVVIKSR
ncbi:MAG: lysylphosphatidylglycerol synthase transmembrane domain-containing protein [Clostridia bacterium]